MIDRALVLFVFSTLRPGADQVADRSVVDAIAAAADSTLEAAELAVYAWHESRAQAHPAPVSWDAHAGLSCGAWQLRCNLARAPGDDARAWLAIVRDRGLVAVDSSPSRARRRETEARSVALQVEAARVLQ